MEQNNVHLVPIVMEKMDTAKLNTIEAIMVTIRMEQNNVYSVPMMMEKLDIANLNTIEAIMVRLIEFLIFNKVVAIITNAVNGRKYFKSCS